MSESATGIGAVDDAVGRLRRGDASARDVLLQIASDRLLRLTRRILHGFPGVARWEQTDDVFQNASVRLYQALSSTQVQDAAHFYRLAAVQIRRECLDLCRHYQGPLGLAANHATWRPSSEASRADQAPDTFETTLDPAKLVEWSELHRQIEKLPPEEREIVDLLWYGGLSHDEAAQALNSSTKTVQRRWRAARLRLYEVMKGQLPDASFA
jgi:RNA polymerase sigma-70 factor (ECF subfamily)